MKLLLVTSRYPFGTGEAFLAAELEALGEHGVETFVLPLRGGQRPARRLPAGATLVAAPLGSWAAVRGALHAVLAHPAATLRAATVMAQDPRPGALLSNLAGAALGANAAFQAEGLEVDHIHAYWASVPATAALIASRMTGIPWSMSCHRGDIVEAHLLPQKVAAASGIRFVAKRSVALAREVLGTRGGPDWIDRARVIHLGIVLPPAPAPARGRQVILCPANLVPVKGHAILLRAFEHLRTTHPAAELWLAGEGPLREALAAQVVATGLSERVRLLGHLPHDDLLRLYRDGAAALVVLASLEAPGGLHEGIPVSLMEAMAHGLPVVATRSGGIPELVSDGAGLLVPPADPVALAAAMARLLDDPAAARAMGEGGRTRVREAFDVQRTTEELLALFTARGA